MFKKALCRSFFIITSFSLIIVGMMSIDERCFAAFSLSVQPFGGGYDLRFGRLGPNDAKQVKEVTIRVTSDIGKQYRLYQRIERPLRSADGREIDLDQFKMFTVISSNSKGSLERIEEYPVMLHDTVLYTSTPAGESDSFKIAYTLTPSVNQADSSYNGRIMFILRAIDSAQDQVIETINMYADLSNEGSVEISDNTGFHRIRFSSRDNKLLSASQYPQVKISVKGNMGSQYRIYQKLRSPQVRSEDGEKFDLSKVTFESQDAKTATMLNRGDLSHLQTKTLVYSSDDAGTATDLIVTYKPSDSFTQQKAGFYTGTIDYSLEVDRPRAFLEPGFLDSMDFEFEIEPIFRIIALSVSESGEVEQEGSMLLQFGEIGYTAGVKESKVRLKIETNIAKPYLVTQRFSASLENETGDKIPDELFTFEMKKTDQTKGKLKFDDETKVKVGVDAPIFISNASGLSDEVDITYKLGVTADTRPGAYTTQVSYSLSEL